VLDEAQIYELTLVCVSVKAEAFWLL